MRSTPRSHRSDDLRPIPARGAARATPRPDAAVSIQRSLGNAYLQAAGPRLRVRSFDVGGASRADKGLVPDTEMQDQRASVGSFAVEARGIGIVVDVAEGSTSPDWPDGLRWTQTIDTNVPLGGTTSPYVDPRPNDDTKPFYWTDAEYAARPTQFEDHPSRGAPASGTTTWRAVLSINGVDAKTVTRFDSITYGFDINSAGTVTGVNATAASAGDIATHRSTLASEFADWTFN